MATWDPNTSWPDLRRLNGGIQYTDSSTVTPEVFNAIVNALQVLNRPLPTGNTPVIISSIYDQFIGDDEIARISYSVDGGTTWLPVANNGVTATAVTVMCTQIRFKIEIFDDGHATYIISSDIPELSISNSRFGMVRTPNVIFDSTDIVTVLIYSY